MIVDLDELRADADPLACPASAAFQDVVHAKFASDFVHALLGSLVLYYRGARDDAQAFRVQVAKLRNHFFGQAVAEILLLRVVA